MTRTPRIYHSCQQPEENGLAAEVEGKQTLHRQAEYADKQELGESLPRVVLWFHLQFNLRIPHRPLPRPEDHERRGQDDRGEEGEPGDDVVLLCDRDITW